MEKQALLTADYLDIVFDNRNKAYGSYELRKHYGQRMQKAMFFVLFLCCGLVAMSLFKKAPLLSDVHLNTDITLTSLDIPPVRLAVPAKPPKNVATVKVIRRLSCLSSPKTRMCLFPKTNP
jgi:protein TonB